MTERYTHLSIEALPECGYVVRTGKAVNQETWRYQFDASQPIAAFGTLKEALLWVGARMK
jgi:hypothetical protein